MMCFIKCIFLLLFIFSLQVFRLQFVFEINFQLLIVVVFGILRLGQRSKLGSVLNLYLSVCVCV